MSSMKTLTELADLYGTDKGTLFHSYTIVYEQILAPLREQPLKILEIGVDKGNSLRMWYDYFVNAHIYGYDRGKARRLHKYDRDRITTFKGDQSKREDLKRFIDKHGKDFDMIVDDGSHHSEHIFISLGFLFPFLKSGGMYFIEDLGAELAQKAQQSLRDFAQTGAADSFTIPQPEVSYLATNTQLCRFLDKDEKLFLLVHK